MSVEEMSSMFLRSVGHVREYSSIKESGLMLTLLVVRSYRHLFTWLGVCIMLRDVLISGLGVVSLSLYTFTYM